MALHLAVQYNHEPVVKLLLAGAANVDAISDVGTALYLAVKNHRDEILQILLAGGADANVIVNDGGVYHTAFCMASGKGHHRIVLALVEASANNNQELDGLNDSLSTVNVLHTMTAFYYALYEGHDVIVELLLSRGANIHIGYPKPWELMFLFLQDRGAYWMDLVLAASADIDAVDAQGRTLLFKMATRGQIEHVRNLAERGANLDLITDTGDFALGAATIRGKIDIVELLLDHDVDTKCIEREAWL
ncbi:hypothetical protein N7G274_004503 [Stereocaulon virgatum]|uniref:Ankyrin n=1 Tax=Stereocaulon virgatum TaxID=373712 RepID=A0ABR4AB91_9LECA